MSKSNFSDPLEFDPSKGFFDLSDMDKLDDQLAARTGQEDIVDKMQTQSDAVSARRTAWANEFRRHWFIYAFLAFSSLFTGTLGVYMGLSPYMKTDAVTGIKVLTFNTDFIHVTLAIVYFLAFVGTTEFQFALAKFLYRTREENNQTQKNTMLIAMVIGIVGLVGTGMAGGMVVASNISFLSDFVNIPRGAQGWVVKAIPIFIGIYTVLYSMYSVSSEKDKTERITREKKRKADLAFATRRDAMVQIAAEHIQAAELNILMDQVARGNLPAARAIKAIQDGKSLAQLEQESQEDINRDGRIGPAPASANVPTVQPPIGARRVRFYTLQEFLKVSGLTEAEIIQVIEKNHELLGPDMAFEYLQVLGSIPADMNFGNFAVIHAEIVKKIPASAGPNGNHKGIVNP